MDNKLSSFERNLRETYEQYETPYNESHWSDLEKELDIAAPTAFKYFSSITTGIAATGLVFIMMLFFFSDVDKYPNGQNQIAEVEVISDSTSSKGDPKVEISAVEPKVDSDELHTAMEKSSVQNIEPEVQKAKSSPAPVGKSNIEKVAKTTAKNSSDKIAETPVSNAAGDKLIRSGCTGFTIQFEAGEEYGKEAKYLWNFGDGYFSNEKNPAHTFNRAGTFDVSLSVTSYSTGKITSNMVQGMIHVVEAPTAKIEVELNSPDQLIFKNKSYRATDIEWLVNNKVQKTGSDLSLNLADNTHFELQLAAYSKVGCTDTLFALVENHQNSKMLPAQFSPEIFNSFDASNYFTSGEIIGFKVFDKVSGKMVHQHVAKDLQKEPALAPGKSYRWVCAVLKESIYSVHSGEFDVK